MKPDCWKCKYVGDVPGSAHASCKHIMALPVQNDPGGNIAAIFASVGRCGPVINVDAAIAMGITLNPHGVSHGWANWPWNFDPRWLLSCDAFTEKREDL